MQPFTIRILGPADIAAVRGLLAVFAEAFEDQDTYAGRQPDDAYLGRLLGRPHVIVVCAQKADAVVGGLVAYQLDKLEQDRREIYIYDLAVAAGHRRRGIATAMIDVLRAEAGRRDAWVVFVQADLVDGPAIALYERFGTRETAHHFDIPPTATADGGD
jgi:aminoglycoside 3-N-acetyltransferase I